MKMQSQPIQSASQIAKQTENKYCITADLQLQIDNINEQLKISKLKLIPIKLKPQTTGFIMYAKDMKDTYEIVKSYVEEKNLMDWVRAEWNALTDEKRAVWHDIAIQENNKNGYGPPIYIVSNT